MNLEQRRELRVRVYFAVLQGFCDGFCHEPEDDEHPFSKKTNAAMAKVFDLVESLSPPEDWSEFDDPMPLMLCRIGGPN